MILLLERREKTSNKAFALAYGHSTVVKQLLILHKRKDLCFIINPIVLNTITK